MSFIKEHLSECNTNDLCWALDIPRPSFYRFCKKELKGSILDRPPSSRKISDKEKRQVLDLLNHESNIDKSPKQVYYQELDKGNYICSSASYYRILKESTASSERRRIRKHSRFDRPELIATAPNQVWSWDVSKLKGPEKFKYYYLFKIIDIYSKYVVGWTVANSETSDIAKKLFTETFKRQNIEPNLLVVHSDRGSIMKSECLGSLYEDIGVTRSLNRPYVSNDNPFSESNFKTLKYRPDYPERFLSIHEADRYLNNFYSWYNNEHYHSGIKMLNPNDIHHGAQAETVAKRKCVLAKAKKKNPERFLGNKGIPTIFEEYVYINRPEENVS